MHTHLSTNSVATFLVLIFLNLAASARTWTDVTGREIQAELVNHDQTNVVLRLPNGRNATVPLKRLSEKDIAFLNAGGGEPATSSDPETANEANSGSGEDEEKLNWEDPWPKSIVFKADPEIMVVEENKETNRFIYTSSHYRFTCDVRLSKSVVSTFADMFESTHDYCRAIPLAITGGGKTDGKYDILLFETKESYFKAGGPPTSAGVFMGRKKAVMVPLTSLGVRKVGSGYMRDRDKSDGTLIHEITHQLTPNVYYSEGARGWFSEGIAEYITATPYRNGRFKVRSNFDDIREYATAYGKKGTRGRALGKEISAPSLKEYMLMEYSDFTGDRANYNYGLGLLITTYFLHLDGEGDAARMKEFLKELRRIGWRGETAKALDKLLDGRTWEELEKAVSKGWGRKGVDITFSY